MNEAIKRAMAEGWKPELHSEDIVYRIEGGNWIRGAEKYYEFLDPLFWQALGKAEGWFYPDGRSVAKYYRNDARKTQYDLWLWNWHRFIDHLASGKDADSFFTNLLAKK